MKLCKKLGLISCILISTQVNALKPSESYRHWTGKLIWKDVIKNHLTVTKEGIEEITINGNVLKFSPESIQEIQLANAGVDEHETEIHSAHCDAESIGGPSGCSKRLVDIKNSIIDILSSTTSPDVIKARQELGRALHTLQDFYAHSNWVNDLSRQGTIYSALTDTVPYLAVQDSYEQKVDIISYKTCEWDLDSFDQKPLETLELDKRGLDVITSGWFAGFYGTSDPIHYKCDHGIAEGNGLNKDTQHQTYHDEAVTAATLHTNAFTTDIISTVLSSGTSTSEASSNKGKTAAHSTASTDAALNSVTLTIEELTKNIDKFMGVLGSSSIGFIVDTTGSMGDTIEGVKNAMKNTVEKLEAEGKDVTKFYLISYSDPGVGNVLTASDTTGMLTNINSVELCVPDCGGDFPEKALDGLIKIVNVAVENTHLYLYTDATTKNSELASSIIKTAKEKNIKINFFLSGSSDSSYNLIAGATQGNIYSYAHSVSGAEGTFAYINPQFEGNVEKLLNVSGIITNGAEPISTVAKLVTNNTSTKKTAVNSSQSSGKHYYALPSKTINPHQVTKIKSHQLVNASSAHDVEKKFYVDDTTTKIFLNVNMDPIGLITLRRPDGSEVIDTDDGVSITNTNASSNIIVTELMIGEWTVELSGSAGQSYDVDIDVASDLRIIDFGFKELKGREGHEALFPINGEPTKASEQFISLSLVGDISGLTMTVNLLDGSVFQNVELDEIVTSTLTSRYLGKLTLPSESFNVVVEGITPSGAKFTRTYNQEFSAQNITVKPINDKPVIFTSDTKYDIGFKVSNLGPADTFALTAELQDGTAIDILENEISIAQDTTNDIRVIFTTPSDLEGLSNYSVTLSVTSLSDSTSSNYAIFSAEIDTVDSDGDSVFDIAENLIFDGNSDDIEDAKQANVVSFLSKSAVGFTYEVEDGLILSKLFNGELDNITQESLSVNSSFGYVEFELLGLTTDSLYPVELKVTFTGEVFPSGYYTYDSTISQWIEDTTVIFSDGYATIKMNESTHKGFFDFSNTPPQAFVNKVTNNKNQAVTLNLLENSYDADSDTIEIIHIDESSLENGVIAFVTDSSTEVTYTPPSDFTGIDNFSFAVTDNKGGFTTVNVEIETNEPVIVPDPPVVEQPKSSGGGSLGVWALMILFFVHLWKYVRIPPLNKLFI